jgi:hypothetical protein
MNIQNLNRSVRRQTLLTFGSAAFAWALASPAVGQTLSPRGVSCGDRELTFDELSPSTSTADAERREELDRLSSYFVAAEVVCNERSVTPLFSDSCGVVNRWRGQRAYPKQEELYARAAAFDSGRQMIAGARQVLANRVCYSLAADSDGDALISACDELTSL